MEERRDVDERKSEKTKKQNVKEKSARGKEKETRREGERKWTSKDRGERIGRRQKTE